MEPKINLETEEVKVSEDQEEVVDNMVEFVPDQKIIYAIENEEGHVTKLVSSVFITEEELAKAKPVDSGNGDSYVHVGEYINNILGKELFDGNGCANFYVAEIQVSLPDEPETSEYHLLERSDVDKQAEIAKRPIPEKIPTVSEVAATVVEISNTVSMLSDAMVEVDNSSSETTTTVEALSNAVVEVDGKTAETQLTVDALSEAIVEVDNKTSVAQAALVERKTDIEIVMDAIVELSEAVAVIQQKLGIE